MLAESDASRVNSPAAAPGAGAGGDGTTWRIAVCLSHFHPTVGGAERQLLQLAGQWAAAGHCVTVYTRAVRGLPARETLDGIEIRRVIRTWNLGPLFGVSYLISLVAQLLWHAREFDRLLAGALRWEAVATGLVSRLCGKPALARVSSVGSEGDLSVTLRARGGRFWRWCLLAHRGVLVPSVEAERECRAAGFSPARIRHVAHGVDVERFQPPPSRTLEATHTALFVGRLAAVKDPGRLLAAWQQVERAGPFRLRLVGDGPLADELRQQARAWALSRIEFLGAQSDTSRYYREASVFVLPSPSEGCSNALLEAMASGLCPVVYRTAGNVDVIEHERTGLLVEPGSTEALAVSLRRALTDADWAGRLGQAARQSMMARHRIEDSAAEYLRLMAEWGGRGEGVAS